MIRHSLFSRGTYMNKSPSCSKAAPILFLLVHLRVIFGFLHGNKQLAGEFYVPLLTQRIIYCICICIFCYGY